MAVIFVNRRKLEILYEQLRFLDYFMSCLYRHGHKPHDLGGQLTGPKREIKCSPNSSLNKTFGRSAVWHVAQSWHHMSFK